MTAKKNNKRYYLHRMLRKTAPDIKLKSRQKTMFVDYDKDVENKYKSQLMALGYSLQTEIA